MSEIYPLSVWFGYFGAVLIGFAVTHLVKEHFKEKIDLKTYLLIPMVLGLIVFVSGYLYIMHYETMVKEWLDRNYPGLNDSYKSTQVAEEVSRFTQRYATELWFVQIGLSASFAAGGYLRVALSFIPLKR